MKSWKSIDVVTDEYENNIRKAWHEYLSMFDMPLGDHFSRKAGEIIDKTKFGRQLRKYDQIHLGCSTLTWRLFQSSSHGKLYVENEAILSELELFLGQRRLAKELKRSKPVVLEEFCDRVRLFINEARGLYYSGIRGKIRKTWEYLQSRPKHKGLNTGDKCQSLLPRMINGPEDTKSTNPKDCDYSVKDSFIALEI